MISWLLYVGIVLLILYVLSARHYAFFTSRGIPEDKPVFLLGSFLDVLTGKKHLFDKIREIYETAKSPCVGLFIFTKPQLMVKDLDMVKTILVKESEYFLNRGLEVREDVDPVAYHAMFLAKDANWRKLRTKISPVFTSGKLKLMYPMIKECGQDLRDFFNKHTGEVVDVRKAAKKFAVDMISSCAFGIQANCLKSEEDSEIMKVSTQLFDLADFKRNLAFLSIAFFPSVASFFGLTFADPQASEYLMNVFKNTLKERREKNIKRNDLIDMLDNLKNQKGDPSDYQFDDLKMASQAITFFSAGNETTSLTIAYALYELALNPDVQAKLREEINETQKKDPEFSYETIHEMKYLNMVVNETLRKYPLTIFLQRVASKKYTFEKTGITVQKGDAILVPLSGIHYDPQYFPEPEKFIPERYSDENKHNIQPFTFMAFGEGPRNCIGQRIALLNVKLALIYSLLDNKLEVCEKTDIPLEYKYATSFLDIASVFLKVVKV